MLRLFLSWIPLIDPRDFVLSHPDFGFQNILVAEDGSLRGPIDRDGVAVVPRCVGIDDIQAGPHATGTGQSIATIRGGVTHIKGRTHLNSWLDTAIYTHK
jgi:hypothetical protein